MWNSALESFIIEIALRWSPKQLHLLIYLLPPFLKVANGIHGISLGGANRQRWNAARSWCLEASGREVPGGPGRIIRELIGKILCSQKRAGFNGFAHILFHISTAICSARVGSTCGGAPASDASGELGRFCLENETQCGCCSPVFLHAESIRAGLFPLHVHQGRGKNTTFCYSETLGRKESSFLSRR